MMASIVVVGISETGPVRQANEDCFLINNIIERSSATLTLNQSGLFFSRYGLLCAIADGMGGEAGGAIASHLALKILASDMLDLADCPDVESSIERIRESIMQAHQVLTQQTAVNPSLGNMGATIVGTYLRPGFGVSFHAGDSRLYRLRESALAQLTTDHSVENLELHRTGEMPTGNKSGAITNCLGGGPGATCSPEIQKISFKTGDTLMLCSDGLSDYLPLETIERVLTSEADPRRKVSHLIEGAVGAGTRDNVTVLLVTSEEDDSR